MQNSYVSACFPARVLLLLQGSANLSLRRKKNHGGYCIADFIHVVGSA
jgi:hypothetical protein